MSLDEECVALYREARKAWLMAQQGGDDAWAFENIADSRYRQIRRDHGAELFYEVDLPKNFRLVHPLGTVLGRAEYADYFVAYHGVSVGSDVDGGRPKFMGPCVLFPHSAVIGSVVIGANVWVTAGTIVEAPPGKPVAIPDNMLVYYRSDRTYGFRYTARSVRERFFS